MNRQSCRAARESIQASARSSCLRASGARLRGKRVSRHSPGRCVHFRGSWQSRDASDRADRSVLLKAGPAVASCPQSVRESSSRLDRRELVMKFVEQWRKSQTTKGGKVEVKF